MSGEPGVNDGGSWDGLWPFAVFAAAIILVGIVSRLILRYQEKRLETSLKEAREQLTSLSVLSTTQTAEPTYDNNRHQQLQAKWEAAAAKIHQLESLPWMQAPGDPYGREVREILSGPQPQAQPPREEV